jgi:PAS domain S-box-containing protein
VIKDQSKTKSVLIRELASLRQKVAELERCGPESRQPHGTIEEQKIFYEEIIQGMVGGVWVTGENDVIFYANRGMAIIAGIPVDQMLGVHVLTGFPEATLQFFRPLYLQARNTLEPRYYDAVRVVTPSGRETYQSGWLIPRIREDRFNGMICTVEDVTERRQAEEALRSSEARFRFITENMSDVAFIQDMNFRTTYVSPSIEMVLGFTPEERLRQTVQEQLTPESLQKVFDTLVVEIEKERTGGVDPNRFLVMELEFYHKNGSIKNLEVLIRGIRDGQGQLTGLHGLARDVTERRKLEAQLLQARKMEAIGKLASGAAHEIRNPLNIMSLKLQLLDVTGKILDADVRELVDTCNEQMRRITGVLDGLQEFSRMPPMKREVHDLHEIIEDVVHSFDAKLKSDGITWEIRCGDGIPPLMLDREKIMTVISHLMSNAVDAMEDSKTKTLRISTEKTPAGGNVCIVVSDTGHGIKEEEKVRIFDPFFTTKGPDRGKGLGLSVSYGIIRDHGGTIRIESNEEGGATFIVELPSEQ